MDNSSLDVLFSISFTNKEFENNRNPYPFMQGIPNMGRKLFSIEIYVSNSHQFFLFIQFFVKKKKSGISGVNESYCYVNETKFWKFEVNDNISCFNFCPGSLSKDFTKDWQSGNSLNGPVYDFSVVHSSFKKYS